MNDGSTRKLRTLADTLFGSDTTEPKVYYLLVGALFLTFFVQPIAGDKWWGLLLVRGTYLTIIVGSIFAMHRRPLALALGLAFSLPGMVIRDMAQAPSVAVLIAADAAMVLALLYVVLVLLRTLLKHPRVTFATVAGATSVYLLIGVMWSMMYYVIEQVEPCSFTGIACVEGAVAGTRPAPDALASLFYFSFVTISTLGYGDISPAAEVARTFAAMEAVIGQLYLVVLLAGLVGLATTSAARQKARASKAGAHEPDPSG